MSVKELTFLPLDAHQEGRFRKKERKKKKRLTHFRHWWGIPHCLFCLGRLCQVHCVSSLPTFSVLCPDNERVFKSTTEPTPPKISPLNFCISKVLNNETIGEMIVSLWLRLLELKLSKCFQRRATTTFCYVHVCTCTWLLCIVTEVLSCIISFLIDAAHWIVQLLAESKVLWTPLIWDFCSWSRF